MPAPQNFISLLPTQCVMSLHCPPSSGSTHCIWLLQHQCPVPSDVLPCNPLITTFSPMGTGGTSCCPGSSCQQPQQCLPQSWIFTPSFTPRQLPQSQPLYLTVHSSPPQQFSHHTHWKDHSWREYFSTSKNIFCSFFEIKNNSCKDVASLTPKKQFLSTKRTLNNPWIFSPTPSTNTAS